MSPLGHYITALGLGLSGAATIGGEYYWEHGHLRILTDTVRWIGDSFAVGQSHRTPYAAIGFFFAFGAIFGARAPDLLERPFLAFVRMVRVIGYRALAHTPWFWTVLSLPVAWLALQPAANDPAMLVFLWVAIGFLAAAWLHLAVDFFSVGGIPWLKPRGTTIGVSVYENGSVSELLLIVPLLAMQFAVPYFIQHPYQF